MVDKEKTEHHFKSWINQCDLFSYLISLAEEEQAYWARVKAHKTKTHLGGPAALDLLAICCVGHTLSLLPKTRRVRAANRTIELGCPLQQRRCH